MRARDLFKARQGIALFRSAACSQTVKLIGAEKDRAKKGQVLSLSSFLLFYYCGYHHHGHPLEIFEEILHKHSWVQQFTNCSWSVYTFVVFAIRDRQYITSKCRPPIARLNIGTASVTEWFCAEG